MAKEWPILFFLAAALMQVRSARMQTVSQFVCFAFETANGTSHRLLAAAAHQGPSPRASVGEARGAAMNRGPWLLVIITRFSFFSELLTAWAAGAAAAARSGSERQRQ